MAKRTYKSGPYEIQIEQNFIEFKEEMVKKSQLILYAIGLKWQEIATKIITANGIVDTGRLRGSLTFITENKQGISIKRVKENREDDFIKGSGEKDTLIVGTNVKYALENELNNPKGAFIRPAINNYSEAYQNLAYKIMKE